MIITKKRIFNVEKYLKSLDSVEEVYVICPNTDAIEMEEGKAFIPAPCGPVTRFNRDGKYIVLKEKEKVPREIEHDYHIIDWHGNDHYGSCIQTKMCYPREYLFPPLEELVIENGFVRSNAVSTSDPERIHHIINMFLEIYGTCEIVDVNFRPICQNSIRKLTWQILPPGRYPWDEVSKRLKEYYQNDKSKTGATVELHHKTISQYVPEFMAIGKDGFYGYVVYGYPSKNLFVFESYQIDNATYIFNGQWEQLSKLTKRELIQDHLYEYRLIHNSVWNKEIQRILNQVVE